MVYDFDGCEDKSPPKLDIKPGNPRDLEVLVVLLEMAALELSPRVFTRKELFAKAQEWAGPEVPIEERDVNIVVPFLDFLKRVPGGLQLR